MLKLVYARRQHVVAHAPEALRGRDSSDIVSDIDRTEHLSRSIVLGI